MTRTAKIMVIMFFCLTGLLTVEQKAASAQSALEKNVIYGQDKIGTYQNELEQSADPSVSVVGVKVRLKQSLGYDVITYAADTWNKTAYWNRGGRRAGTVWFDDAFLFFD